MSYYTALIVDDEPDILELLTLTLGRMDIITHKADTLERALEQLKTQQFDLCLSDMRLPDGSGLDLVNHIQQHHPTIPVAIITAHGNMEAAVTALKGGAFDFVSKPIDLKVLRNLVTTALKISAPKDKPLEQRSRYELLGDSPAMRNIRNKIAKLARSQAPVYISGESGTGKELVARLIHDKGPRANKPFIPVNCGAIPDQLMESEFFGHKKGSFTGANIDKQGLFQAADGGTLFLDEVADLPQHMQVKLLRAIQEKAIRPLGGHQEESIDVRILSATHKNLANMVTTDDFRQDLFYRINVIELKVPNLKEREQDALLLTKHFLSKITQTMGITKPQLSTDAQAALQNYPFPGNVRELENILERAITLCDNDCITTDDLQLPSLDPTNTHATNDSKLTPYLDTQERQAITKALEQTRYNKTAAAKLLGISFRALRYRLKKLGLD